MSETIGPLSRTERWQQQRNDAQARLDQVCDDYLACFTTPAGKRVLLDLEALVMVPCLAPTATEAELRHLNGQKSLFGVITQRIEHARRNRAGGAGQPAAQPGPGRQPARTVRRARKRVTGGKA